MSERSRLVKMRIVNLGCVGPAGLEVSLDNIICIVGANNSGKSTVLRAYELAVGNASFSIENDLCKSAADSPTIVEIWVNIPKGTENIAEKWKTEENGLLLVRSKWEWNQENGWKKVRSTWDPQLNDYSPDDKASGLDTVFSSRLPIPFRIGSLDDPQEEHKRLLTLIVQPIAEKLQKDLKDEESKLKKAISSVTTLANEPIMAEKEKLDTLKIDLNKSHNRIFPDLAIDFQIGIGEIQINLLQQLKDNSYLKFKEWEQEVQWSQQGTGSQRALFWTMLQVRSKLKTIFDEQQQTKKTIEELEKKIKKLQGEADKAKKEDTKQAKYSEIINIESQIQQLKNPESAVKEKGEQHELILPGYMLIIDEPEIGLHPNAIRAACDYLYGLADDPSWQVMLATHSPAFIDPLKDHTTIIRLDRCQKNPSPNTYRSDSIKFSEDEVENLKMLNRFDPGLAEMFFGQYPILIEGDTEFAAFESIFVRHPHDFQLSKKPVFIRARGKYTMLLIIKMLREFKVSFAILHDADYPTRRDGKKNTAWSANEFIYQEISESRKVGIKVVHRISLPNFELAHLPIQNEDDVNIHLSDNMDKPWKVFSAIHTNPSVEESILKTFLDLINIDANQETLDEPFDKSLKYSLETWAKKHAPKDSRFIFQE